MTLTTIGILLLAIVVLVGYSVLYYPDTADDGYHGD